MSRRAHSVLRLDTTLFATFRLLARIALDRLGLVGKGIERDRRPTQAEIDRIVAAFESNTRQHIPVGRIIHFAIATAMRQDEISRMRWDDFDPVEKMLLIRDRKDTRRKSGKQPEDSASLRLRLRFLCDCRGTANAFRKEQGANFSLQWKVGWNRFSKTMP